jgi:hypothetical protein
MSFGVIEMRSLRTAAQLVAEKQIPLRIPLQQLGEIASIRPLGMARARRGANICHHLDGMLVE